MAIFCRISSRRYRTWISESPDFRIGMRNLACANASSPLPVQWCSCSSRGGFRRTVPDTPLLFSTPVDAHRAQHLPGPASTPHAARGSRPSGLPEHRDCNTLQRLHRRHATRGLPCRLRPCHPPGHHEVRHLNSLDLSVHPQSTARDHASRRNARGTGGAGYLGISPCPIPSRSNEPIPLLRSDWSLHSPG